VQAQINFEDNAVKGQNYIYAKTYLLIGQGSDPVESIQYFDGLGRPLQTVQYKASPTQKDVIQPYVYDQYGREVIQYLPYTETATGCFRNNWEDNQSPFHENIYGEDDGSKAYTQTLFENSPLNRVMKQGAPGEAWQPVMTTPARGSGEKVTSYQYLSNGSDLVYYWSVSTGTYPSVTFARNTYGPNTLFKTIVTDENGHPSTEYKDKNGKVVLKTDAMGGKTYYIYDDFELLRCVIPPLGYATLAYGASSFNTSTTDFKELCYYYEYDARKNMIKK